MAPGPDKVELEQIWTRLQSEVESATHSTHPTGLVRRLVSNPPSAEVHLAITLKDSLCAVLVAMPDSWDEDISHFPRWSGMSPAILVGNERPKPRKFLLLGQEAGSSTEVFRAVVADLIGAIGLAIPERVEQVIADRLERWKSFFEHAGGRGLGLEAQQGLFGELWLLGEHLIPILGAVRALSGWTGPQRANNDFQYGKHAIEVKTSSAKEHQKILVSSERQLSTVGLTSLNIAFISLAASEGGGLTLAEQVAATRTLLESDPPSLRMLDEKLIEAGYTDAHAGMYTTGYAVRNLKIFEISEAFPMIRESEVPSGIGDISYSIVVSACEPFKISKEKVWARISEGKEKTRVL